jgi:predicted nucleic acid-binding protein
MSVDFIDSNVFVYYFDQRDPAKQAIAQQLVRRAVKEGAASISYQVVQETLNVITRKIKPPATAAQAEQMMQVALLPLWRVVPSASLFYQALQLQARTQYSFYDSLIIAAALEAGCTRLLSEDLQHGQQIDSLRIENPFLLDEIPASPT